ncbi:MAG TPA: hypothetical protein VLH60_04965 [Sedimentisphaerales bacterium]|nr:hypothetical protein [Sedimentisphaerales bacterium]
MKYVLVLAFMAGFCCAIPSVLGSEQNLADSNAPLFPSWPPDPNAVFPEPQARPEAQRSPQHTSVLNAASFIRLARHLYTSPGADVHDKRAALVFVNAAMLLDPFSAQATEDFLHLKTSLNEREDWTAMRRMLITHLEQNRDIEVARAMVRYLLEGMNSREERERVLIDLYNIALDKNNKELASDIAVEYGILIAERGDMREAGVRYMTAYRLNPFNVLACTKLAEVAQNELTPTFRAMELRLAMTRDPLDLGAVLAFAGLMEWQGFYRVASLAYEYAANLHKYLYPQQELPAQIYRPWALSYYNQEGRADKCIEIAQAVRASGRFDAIVEGIAKKAAERENLADDVAVIASRVNKMLEQAGAPAAGDAVEMSEAAWYYAFAAKDSGKALSWANMAYAADPNSRTARALLVYALVINGQAEVTGELVTELEREALIAQSRTGADQIVELAMGVKLLGEQKKDEAIAALKRAVAIRPAAVEANQARELLAYHGELFSGIDETTASEIGGELRNNFGEDIVPQWISPENLVSVRLVSRMHGVPSFDSELMVEMIITNNWRGPLMVGHGGLIGGHLRIDGELQGDIRRTLPNLVSRRLGRWSVLRAGQSMVIPLDMNISGIYDALQEYPQANLNIVFTAYLDPVEGAGAVRNRIAGLEPGRLTIERRGVSATREFVANRLDALASGYQSQKVRAARMFVSFLRESRAAAEGRINYEAARLEPALLKSAVISALNDVDETVKVQTMAAMPGMELDYDLLSAVSEGLSSEHWPTRLMCIYLLASAQGEDFAKVLNWHIESDKDVNVRRMAEVMAQKHAGSRVGN